MLSSRCLPTAGLMRIWLASNSARRAAWLTEHLASDLHCEGLVDVDESTPHSLVSERVVVASRAKLNALPPNEYEIIIIADTLVEDPDDPYQALGKPENEIEAAVMLHRLSGRRHKVWSATIVVKGTDVHEFLDQAVVEFSQLSDEELIDLVTSGSWQGKAGGYDMAGAASNRVSLVAGEEVTVLGLASSAITFLDEILVTE